MTTTMAPYIYKNGKWVDANDALDIRKKESYTGTPTTTNVPTVNVMSNGNWKQIYPPEKITQPELPWREGSSYKNWQGGEIDRNHNKVVWGWSMSTPALENLQWTGGQGYFGTGQYSYEIDVYKEFAGWMGLTRNAITNAGYKGLGKVTKVNKLTIEFTFLDGVGTPSIEKKIGLIATTVGAPKVTNLDSDNPCLSKNRSEIIFSDESKASNGVVTFTWTSKNALDVIKQMLNGVYGYNNLCTYTRRFPGYDGVGFVQTSLYYYSKDYTRYTKIRYKLEYEYQP